MKGGNTDEFYAIEGTFNKSDMLVRLHPDVAEHYKRYGRDHHRVNYVPFKDNLFRKKPGDYEGVNEYGMRLVDIED